MISYGTEGHNPDSRRFILLDFGKRRKIRYLRIP
jgi:hypothetical protein